MHSCVCVCVLLCFVCVAIMLVHWVCKQLYRMHRTGFRRNSQSKRSRVWLVDGQEIAREDFRVLFASCSQIECIRVVRTRRCASRGFLFESRVLIVLLFLTEIHVYCTCVCVCVCVLAPVVFPFASHFCSDIEFSGGHTRSAAPDGFRPLNASCAGPALYFRGYGTICDILGVLPTCCSQTRTTHRVRPRRCTPHGLPSETASPTGVC